MDTSQTPRRSSPLLTIFIVLLAILLLAMLLPVVSRLGIILICSLIA